MWLFVPPSPAVGREEAGSVGKGSGSQFVNHQRINNERTERKERKMGGKNKEEKMKRKLSHTQDTQTDRQTDIRTDRRTYGQIDVHTEGQTGGWTNRTGMLTRIAIRGQMRGKIEN